MMWHHVQSNVETAKLLAVTGDFTVLVHSAAKTIICKSTGLYCSIRDGRTRIMGWFGLNDLM